MSDIRTDANLVDGTIVRDRHTDQTIGEVLIYELGGQIEVEIRQFLDSERTQLANLGLDE